MFSLARGNRMPLSIPARMQKATPLANSTRVLTWVPVQALTQALSY